MIPLWILQVEKYKLLADVDLSWRGREGYKPCRKLSVVLSEARATKNLCSPQVAAFQTFQFYAPIQNEIHKARPKGCVLRCENYSEIY